MFCCSKYKLLYCSPSFPSTWTLFGKGLLSCTGKHERKTQTVAFKDLQQILFSLCYSAGHCCVHSTKCILLAAEFGMWRSDLMTPEDAPLQDTTKVGFVPQLIDPRIFLAMAQPLI